MKKIEIRDYTTASYMFEDLFHDLSAVYVRCAFKEQQKAQPNQELLQNWEFRRAELIKKKREILNQCNDDYVDANEAANPYYDERNQMFEFERITYDFPM